MGVGTAGGGGCHPNYEGGSIERDVKMVDRGLASLPVECDVSARSNQRPTLWSGRQFVIV